MKPSDPSRSSFQPLYSPYSLCSLSSADRLFAAVLVLLFAALFVSPSVARALPADAYQVELISQPGATSTSVRGVDSTGRALLYWSLFTQPPPLPINAEPDDEGYAFWQNGVSTPIALPGLTDPNIHRMNVGGAIWGNADEGAFVYQDGDLTILSEPSVDVTIVQGVDELGRIYGLLGNYPPGVDPDAPLVPIDPVGSFVWENDTFNELNLLLEGGTLHGVLQDGTLWGSNQEDAFIQEGLDLTVIDHPGFDYTGFHALSADEEAFGFGLTIEEPTFASETFFWDAIQGFAGFPDGSTLPGTDVVPHAMNEAGVFWGIESNNTAFVATAVPEPSTALLLSLGVALALRRHAAPRVSQCPPEGPC